jgi:nitrogen-specific signal transduction histidine kinase
VVNKHHGDIRIDSEPGRTSFRVSLPISGLDPAAPGDAAA